MPLTHLSLFSGIGGLDIAAEMAGIETVGQCEWADFQTKILEKHWPNVPKWRDIRTLTAESFYEKTNLRTVDIISGGFPCQPFSIAGKRKGEADDRFLWPEMLRVIRELRPTWVIGENVPGIVNMALDTVLSDLEGQGYSAQAFIVPACGVDAPHKRNRVAIVAPTGSWPCDGWNRSNGNHEAMAGDGKDYPGRIQELHGREWREDESGIVGMADGISEGLHAAHPDSEGIGLERLSSEQICRGGVLQTSANGACGSHSPWQNWPDEPGICRVVDGVPNRVDRIKSLGNAVVPQQFYIFFKLIADIENGKTI